MEKEKQPNVLSEVPAGYKLGQTIDLQNNRKQFFLVNGMAFLVDPNRYISVLKEFEKNHL
jgi:hypothetical protein